MPRFYPSVLISDAYGSVGDVTFYHKGGKCFYMKRSHSRYPGLRRRLPPWMCIGVPLPPGVRSLTNCSSCETDWLRKWSRIGPPLTIRRISPARISLSLLTTDSRR